jgi:hypothetical protein
MWTGLPRTARSGKQPTFENVHNNRRLRRCRVRDRAGDGRLSFDRGLTGYPSWRQEPGATELGDMPACRFRA